MIALIAGPTEPPRVIQGLGPPYLAAVLERAGYEVEIFDLYPPVPETEESDEMADPDLELADMVASKQPRVIGMAIHTADYAARVRLAGLIRERLPEALMVAGGHHPSAEPSHLLRNSDFDVCVIGEGEYSLLEIVERFTKGGRKKAGDWLSGIPGLVYRRGEEILNTGPPQPVMNLDDLPFPAHHLLGIEDYAAYSRVGVKSTSIISYRGCAMRCAFCHNPLGNRIRKRSPRGVAEEMSRVVDGFRVRGFTFHDNIFGLDRKHALALCGEIEKRRPDVFWDSWTVGDVVDDELAARMKAAGCITAGFGAESGDDHVLLKSRRGFTAKQNQAGIDALRNAGLKVDVFFMIGLPGESNASIQRTIEFAAGCGADTIHLSVYRPWPGTDIWNDPEAFDVRITHGENFEAYIETRDLTRDEILAGTKRALEELKRQNFDKVATVRYDKYDWE